MDDDVDVVEEDPFALAAAFDRGGVEAVFLLEAELDFVGDGDDLTVVGRGGDEEEIGEARVGGIEFEDPGVFAFFIVAGSDGGEELAASFRSGHWWGVSPHALASTNHGSRK